MTVKADLGLNRAFSVFSNTPTPRANLNSLQGMGVAEQSLQELGLQEFGLEEFGRGRLDRTSAGVLNVSAVFKVPE